jgi:hypothetical protein
MTTSPEKLYGIQVGNSQTSTEDNRSSAAAMANQGMEAVITSKPITHIKLRQSVQRMQG